MAVSPPPSLSAVGQDLSFRSNPASPEYKIAGRPVFPHAPKFFAPPLFAAAFRIFGCRSPYGPKAAETAATNTGYAYIRSQTVLKNNHFPGSTPTKYIAIRKKNTRNGKRNPRLRPKRRPHRHKTKKERPPSTGSRSFRIFGRSENYFVSTGEPSIRTGGAKWGISFSGANAGALTALAVASTLASLARNSSKSNGLPLSSMIRSTIF